MRTAAILPVKRFSRAKQRLGADVSAELRVALARAMVADVLDALARTAAIELVIVVSSEQSLAGAAALWILAMMMSLEQARATMSMMS